MTQNYLQLIKSKVLLQAGITERQLKSKCRKRDLVEARQIFCYLADKYTMAILETIGEEINRDHTTVIHSKQVAEDLIFSNTFFRRRVKALEFELERYNDSLPKKNCCTPVVQISRVVVDEIGNLFTVAI